MAKIQTFALLVATLCALPRMCLGMDAPAPHGRDSQTVGGLSDRSDLPAQTSPHLPARPYDWELAACLYARMSDQEIANKEENQRYEADRKRVERFIRGVRGDPTDWRDVPRNGLGIKQSLSRALWRLGFNGGQAWERYINGHGPWWLCGRVTPHLDQEMPGHTFKILWPESYGKVDEDYIAKRTWRSLLKHVTRDEAGRIVETGTQNDELNPEQIAALAGYRVIPGRTIDTIGPEFMDEWPLEQNMVMASRILREHRRRGERFVIPYDQEPTTCVPSYKITDPRESPLDLAREYRTVVARPTTA